MFSVFFDPTHKENVVFFMIFIAKVNQIIKFFVKKMAKCIFSSFRSFFCSHQYIAYITNATHPPCQQTSVFGHPHLSIYFVSVIYEWSLMKFITIFSHRIYLFLIWILLSNIWHPFQGNQRFGQILSENWEDPLFRSCYDLWNQMDLYWLCPAHHCTSLVERIWKVKKKKIYCCDWFFCKMLFIPLFCQKFIL